jgi:hypothetical protein
MELFAREVMGEFHDRADEAERSKAARLAPAIDRALERRPPPRAAPADYTFPAAAFQF